MKVMLLQDLPGRGKAGEIREVPKGYAKNFLLPRGLALVATSGVTKEAEAKLQRQKLAESIDREKLVGLARQIEGKEIRFKARAGSGERLFGSITAANIAEELSRIVASAIDKKDIEIEQPLRQTGSYTIAVKLASDIRPQFTVVIEPEEEEKIEEKALIKTEQEAGEKTKEEPKVEKKRKTTKTKEKAEKKREKQREGEEDKG